MTPKFVLLGVAIVSSVLCLATGDTTVLTDTDKSRLKKVVELAKPLAGNSVSHIYYYVNVHLLLDGSVADSAAICTHIKQVPATTLDAIYFVTSTAKLLNCQLDATKFATSLQGYAKEDSSVQDLYQTGLALANLGKTIDSTRFAKLLLAALKREETLQNIGLAFQLASKFTKAEDRTPFVEKIGDVIIQADEVNEKLLQFEGGLGVSSAIINGIYQLATASNKPLGLTNDQALKFVNYFLSRKYVLTPKGASDVIESLALFTKNKYHIPYLITKYGSSALSLDNPILTLKVTNVLGASVGPLSLTATSVSRTGEPKPVLENVIFKPVTGDSTLFAYDFFEKPLPSGFYSLSVNAMPQKADARILGNTGVVIKASILTQIDVVNAELAISDMDIGSKSVKLQYPSAASETFEADYTQRLQFKFQVNDRQTGKGVQVHQAFLRFFNEQTKQEIVFISELDSANFYKVDLALQARSKDFNNLSGKYRISLIVGDALVVNALHWNLGTINLQFGSSSSSPATVSSEFSLKPEITHIFREQDKRPHPMVSTFFSCLVLVPLLALFVMWFKIGINFSGFTFSLSSILFHVTLALIFLLYACFFVKLNMFQTIKYLAGFSVVIYISGHSLLSSLIKKNK